MYVDTWLCGTQNTEKQPSFTKNERTYVILDDIFGGHWLEKNKDDSYGP